MQLLFVAAPRSRCGQEEGALHCGSSCPSGSPSTLLSPPPSAEEGAQASEHAPPPPPPTPGEVTKEEALPDTVGGMENAQAVSRC